MIQINKSMLNRETGLMNVNLVRKENRYKSFNIHSADQANEGTKFRPGKYSIRSFKDTLLASSFLLFAFNAESYAQQIYDGSSALLTGSDAISGNFENIIGDSSLFGFIVRDGNGDPILTGTNATINYNSGQVPDFVVAGYSGLFGTGTKTTATNDNVLTFLNGTVSGDVYAGLSHYTDVVGSIDCQKLGKCDVESKLSGLKLDANGNKIQYDLNNSEMKKGRLKAGTATTRQVFDTVTAGSSSSYFAQAKPELNDSVLTTSKNTIEINGSNNKLQDGLSAGDAGIYQSVAAVQAGTAASTNASIFPKVLKNTLVSSQNTISINSGENNIGGDLSAGSATIQQYFGALQGGNYTSADIRSNADTKTNTLTASSNTINIEDNKNTIRGDVNSGAAGVKIGYGTSQTGSNGFGNVKIEHYSYANQLTASQNATNIRGTDNVIIGNINTGTASLKHEYGDASASGNGTNVTYNA
ncbi:MAG: hypothetical protein LBI75_04640, partial [Brucellaceae bacterium]|nr:hypothetical protein [Brucellaceae bacterium]